MGPREAGSSIADSGGCGGSGSAVSRALRGPLPSGSPAVAGESASVSALPPRVARSGCRADALVPAMRVVSHDAVVSSCACMERREDSDSWRRGSESVIVVDPEPRWTPIVASDAAAAATNGLPVRGTWAAGGGPACCAGVGRAPAAEVAAALMCGRLGSGVMRPLAKGPVPGRMREEEEDDITDACPT